MRVTQGSGSCSECPKWRDKQQAEGMTGGRWSDSRALFVGTVDFPLGGRSLLGWVNQGPTGDVMVGFPDLPGVSPWAKRRRERKEKGIWG